MSQPLRIIMGQLNFFVGDVAGNTDKLISAAHRARDEFRGDLIVFPELALSGYPPEDLLFRAGLLRRVDAALVTLTGAIKGIDAIVGHPHRKDDKLFNAASLIRGGRIAATYFKHHLPNYGVFDEKRYFVSGSEPCLIDVRGIPVGITICEDVWDKGPVEQTAQSGAKLVVNIN
ncbi:MAG: NAD+ synthase, partial [Burkholderiales bacterium]|nr:NAD+ synthase [Burkholderiales bacterium]